jgi:hypothetical protein
MDRQTLYRKGFVALLVIVILMAACQPVAKPTPAQTQPTSASNTQAVPQTGTEQPSVQGGTIVLALNACAPKDARPASAQEQPRASMATATVEPVQNPASESKTAISCNQLIPPDEAKSLFVDLNATSSKQIDSGQTTCTWQYTSKSSGQADALVLMRLSWSAPARHTPA